MPSVLCIKRVIMTNLNRCDNHITIIDYTYITKYLFKYNIFFKYIYKHQYIIIFFSIKI